MSSTGRFTYVPPPKKEQEKKTLESFPQLLLGILWTPSLDGYTFQDGAKEGEIDGQNLFAGEVYGLRLQEKHFIGGFLRYARGKVFGDEDYTTTQMRLSAGKMFEAGPLKFGGGVAAGYLRGNSYSIVSDRVKAESLGALQYGPSLLAIYHLKPGHSILTTGSYLLGDVSELDASVDYLYLWKGHYLQGGVNLNQRSFDMNSGEQTSLGLRLGIAKPF